MIVVGLSGVARAGKDEAASALVRQLGFTKIGYAEALRAGLLALNPIVAFDTSNQEVRYADVIDAVGYEVAKELPEVRRLLQRYGTEAARNVFGDNIWVDTLFARAEAAGVERLVIPDVRFPNEVQGVESRWGLVLRISRPGKEPVNTHPSDTSLTDDDFNPEEIILNNGTVADLHRKVVRLVSERFEL